MKRLAAVIVALSCGALGNAQSGTTNEPLRLSGVETQAAVIRNVRTGDVVYSYNADKRMTPASLTKLVTTAAAMHTLGAKARYATTAYYDGANKTLYIRGGGDPTVNSRYFEWHTARAWAQRIAESLGHSGVKALDDVVVDLGAEQQPALPSSRLWEDMGNYYGAVPHAINYADNSFTLTLSSPAEVGRLCKVVGTEPRLDVGIDCYVRSAAIKGDSAYIYGTEGGRWYVSGAIPAAKSNFGIRGAMPEPYRPFVGEIVQTLRAKGIELRGEGRRGTMPQGLKVLATLESPTVEAICRETNKHSVNLFADALMLRLSGGEPSWDAGTRALRAFYKQAANAEAIFCDGSGLSPFNVVSVRGLTDVLVMMHGSAVGEKYRQTLAVAGRDGTLRQLGRGTPIEGRVVGKSGSMSGVLGYAGYATGKDGQTYVFSIIVNHHTETNAEVRREIVRWLTHHIAF